MRKIPLSVRFVASLLITCGFTFASYAQTSCPSLVSSGPVVATRNGQVIENLSIVAENGQPGILVQNLSNVVIRNVQIRHKRAAGIKFSNSSNISITNASIEYTEAPTVGPNSGEFNNIDGYNSPSPVINQVRLKHGSSGIYLNRTDSARLSFIQGEDFRGPFPRGQLVQFNACNNSSLTDFSSVNDRNKAWTEDNVNIYHSNNVTVQRGLVDGNNSPSGVGVIADNDAHDILVEDVDAIHQGGGCFSANQIDGVPAVTNVTFKNTRCKDNSIASFLNRGVPGSNGLGWCAEPRTHGVKVLNSKYYNLAVPYNIGWNWSTFETIDVRKEDFTPRPPLALNFCWENNNTGSASLSDTYASDMTPVSATSGYGPYEKDRSNGESSPGDGRFMRLNGETFQKGLGVHSNSNIEYALNKKCVRFTAKLGIDDEVGNNGLVQFQVYGDGVKLYETGALSGASATVPVSVDMTNVNRASLLVNALNDHRFNHADWADAKFSCTNAAAKTYYLSDLTETASQNGYGPVEKNKSNGEMAANDGRTITLKGQTYAKGLGMHAPAKIDYKINGQCTKLTAVVGVDSEVGLNGSIRFRVVGDGKELFNSGTMTGNSNPLPVSVALNNVTNLSLLLDPVNTTYYAHGDWADARITCNN